MSGMDRFYKRQKEKQSNSTSNSPTFSGGGMERYHKNQYYRSLDTSGVDENYINTFISDTSRFFSGVNDKSVSYDAAKSTLGDLSTRYDTIQGWLYKNKSNLNEEAYTSISSTLGGFKSGFDGVKDFYSQWESEDDYQTSQKDEKNYQEELAKEQNNGEKLWNGKTEGEWMLEMNPSQRWFHFQSGGFVDTEKSWEEKVSFLIKKIQHGDDPDYAETKKTLRQLKAAIDTANSSTSFSDIAKAGSITTELYGYYNQLITQMNADVLSKTKTEGKDWSLLEEIKRISNMDAGEEKDNRKASIISEMEALGIPAEDYALFSDDSNFSHRKLWQMLGYAGASGLNSVWSGLASTGDFLFGNLLDAAGWEGNPFSLAKDYWDSQLAISNFNRGLLTEQLGGGDALQLAGDVAQVVAGGVPYLITAWATGGASAANDLSFKAAYETGNILTKAGLTVSSMMKNPNYWFSVASTVGNDYEQAKAMGASDTVAALGATLTSLVNAGIEIGIDGTSGIQGLPQELAEEGGSKLLKWVVSSVEEGGEEGLQRFVNEAVTKALYNHDAEILKPADYARDMGLGTFAGMALGGGQIATGKAVNAVNSAAYTAKKNNRNKRIYGNSEEDLQALITEGLESTKGSMSNTLAQKYQQKLDSGKKLTGSEISQLITANDEAIRAEELAYVKSEIQEKLTELGETGDVSAIADVIMKKASGEILSNTEKELLKSSKYASNLADNVHDISKSGRIDVDEYTKLIQKLEAEDSTKAVTEAQFIAGKDTTSYVDSSKTDAGSASEVTLESLSAKYGNQAKAMVETYKRGNGHQDIQKFDEAFAYVYGLGKENGNLDGLAENDSIAGYLTEQQKQYAYEAGKAAAESNTVLKETGESVKVKRIASIDNGKMTFELDNGQVATAEQLTFSDNDALLYNAISEMDISAEDANKLLSGYDGSTTMEAYATGIQLAYDYGVSGIAYNRIDSRAFGAALDENIKKIAYNLGKKALETKNDSRYNNNITETEGNANGTGEGLRLREGVQRADGPDSGGQVSGVEETSRGVQERNANRESGIDGSNSQKTEGRVNAAGLGIRGGTGEANLQRVGANYSAKTKKAAKLGAENGVEVVFFIGGNLQVIYEGKLEKANGLIVNGVAYIRADDPTFTADQIMMHEITHPKIDRGEIDPKSVYAKLVEHYKTDAKIKAVIAEYAKAHGMVAENASADEIAKIADEVFVEIVCDSEAGMNFFSVEAKADAIGFMEQVQAATKADIDSRETRGPPEVGARFSRNTEERRRALRKGEMVNSFKDKINWPHYYQKIMNVEYNPDNFDDGGIARMELDGALITLEMQENGEWSVIGWEEIDNANKKQPRAQGVGSNGGKRISGERYNNSPMGGTQGAGQRGGVATDRAATFERSDSEGNDTLRTANAAQTARNEVATKDSQGRELSQEQLSREHTQEVNDNGRREEIRSDTGNVESQGALGEDDARREGSARQSCERRIAEILREKILSRNSTRTLGRGRVEQKESREDFESRVRNDGYMYAETGGLALAFKVSSKPNENAKIATENLKRFGFDVIAFDGELRSNKEGVTETSITGITVRSGGKLTIFISAELDIDGLETAYHEAFHAARYGLMAKYHENIAGIIAGSVDAESPAFEKFISIIAEKYAYSKRDVSIKAFAKEIVEEFYAWYVGKSYAHDGGEMLLDMEQFSNVAGIKEQIDGIYAQMEEHAGDALPGLAGDELFAIMKEGGRFSRLEQAQSVGAVRFSREFIQEQELLQEEVNNALAVENAKLKADNERLNELVKLQKTVTGGTMFTKTSVEAAARLLKKKGNVKNNANSQELASLLNEFYGYIAKGEELTWENVMEAAQPAVDWLKEHRRESLERDEYAQFVLDNIRGSKIRLDASQKAEAAYKYGSLQAFRQKLMGILTVSDSANMTLDEFWHAVAEEHPYYFSEDVNAGDQVAGVIDAVERLRRQWKDENSEFNTLDKIADRELLYEVYDSYWNVSTLYTFADVKQRQINRLKAEHREKILKIKADNKSRILELDAYYNERMERIREAYQKRTAEKIKRLKAENWQKRREDAAARREADAVKKNRTEVEKQAKKLLDMLRHPTKEAHVPSSLQEPLQELLDSIDFSSKTQLAGEGMTIRDIAYTRALHEMRKAVAEQRSALDGKEDGVFELDVPESFVKDIDKHISTINSATKGLDLSTNRVYEMSSAELADLGYLLRTINKAIRDVDKLHMEGAKARVSELAKSTMEEMKTRKPVKGETGGKFMWANYTPYHAFRRMGSAGQQIFRGLMQGQAKLARNTDSILRFAETAYSEKEVAAWENPKNAKTIQLDSGKTIQMTPAQIMSFYCLSAREQAVGHMKGGGIKLTAIGEGLAAISQKGHFILTVADINRINELLTDRQLEVAKKLQKFMQDVGGRFINEISMARWDYMAATERNYFPIKTDEATRDAKSPDREQTSLWAMLNKSFNKAITPNANNVLVVSSIFDVFADHMSETAEYNAFALPLVDAMRWFNYRERIQVGSSNKSGADVLEDFLQDNTGTKQRLSRERATAEEMEEQSNDERRTGGSWQTDSPRLAGEQNSAENGRNLGALSAEYSWQDLGTEKQRQVAELLGIYAIGDAEAQAMLEWYADGDISDKDIRLQALRKMAEIFYTAMQGNRVLLENDGRFKWLRQDLSVCIQDVEAIEAGTYNLADEWETDDFDDSKFSREATVAPESAAEENSAQIEDVGVQRALRDTLGTAATKYFVDLMLDINSGQKAGRHDDFISKMLSRSKVASVGWNSRVAIQQPSAILRASLILDMPSLLKGTARIGTKALVKEMQTYSGIALWKSMGYYDLNVSRNVREQIKGNTKLLDKFNEVGMWLPGKMDEITWARIWAATKAKVAKEQKLTGDDLLHATAEMFEDIVYQTQVADSVLTRSSAMRSKSQAMREVTSFMAEPTIAVNILMSAFQDYDNKHTTWDKTKRALLIGFNGYILATVANALLVSLIDAWRDDDEYEDFLDKYGQALIGDENFWDGNLFNELNPLGKIVFVRDVLSAIQGYDVMPAYAKVAKYAYDFVTNLQKRFSGKGTITDYGLVYQGLQLLSSSGGIGLSSISREAISIWNNIFGKIYPELVVHRYESGAKAKIRDAYTGGHISAEKAAEELIANGVAEDENDAYWTVKEWDSGEGSGYSKYGTIYDAVRTGFGFDAATQELLKHGHTEKEVISQVQSQIGKWYRGTDSEPQSISKQQAIDMLTKYTNKNPDEITKLVNKWSCKVVTGIAYEDIKSEMLSGNITKQRAIEMLVCYGGYTKTDAAKKVRSWELDAAKENN